jgi:hypothetical protein
MSRNEMFLLLACAFVAAIMSGSPASTSHQPTVTIASLLAPTQDSMAWNDTTIAQQSFDRQ